MTQGMVVARLALRELWISYRLLLILVAFIGAGAVVALLPAVLPVTLQRLSIGLGAATVVTAVIAAWTVAEERSTGRAGWLVSRSVPRGTILVGWFTTMALTVLAAMATTGLLGWLAASSVSLRLEWSGFVSLLGGVGSTALAAIAVGIVAGLVLPARAAVVVVAAICIALGMAAVLLAPDPAFVPGGAFVALAGLQEPGSSIAPGLRTGGIGLAFTAILLAAARVVLERIDL